MASAAPFRCSSSAFGSPPYRIPAACACDDVDARRALIHSRDRRTSQRHAMPVAPQFALQELRRQL